MYLELEASVLSARVCAIAHCIVGRRKQANSCLKLSAFGSNSRLIYVFIHVLLTR